MHVPTQLQEGILKHGASSPTVTLRDVAARAGVSLASASCALGHGRRGASDEMRAKVARAAAELGYELRPRGRRRSRSLTVAAVIPDIGNQFFDAMLGSVDAALRDAGHRMIVLPTGDDAAIEDDLIARVASRIDGLVLAPSSNVGPATDELVRRGRPVVLVDRDGGAPHLPSVTVDNFESAREATMVLVEHGFRRIAMVNGPSRVSTACARTAGYLAALATAGRTPIPDLLCTGEFSFEDGRSAVHHLLATNERPDAIFSASALLTSGVLYGLHEHALQWPEDVAVVGYGDAVFASLLEPAVTVVEQPTVAMGQAAVQILLSGTASQHEAGHVVLSSKLVLRDSHFRTQRHGVLPLSRER